MKTLCKLALATLVCAGLVAQNFSFASLTARTVPEWLNRAVIYEVWLNAFSQEGTLRHAEAAVPGRPRRHYRLPRAPRKALVRPARVALQHRRLQRRRSSVRHRAGSPR